jgi:kynurenine aminotransferase
MFAFATAFLQPGDEVILFEPCASLGPVHVRHFSLPLSTSVFDQYIAQVNFNGGTPVFVPIRAPAAAATSTVSASEWKLDLDELRAAITPKTKMIWINTPHNPIGKVFDEEELRGIGKVAEEADLMILSDEVVSLLGFGRGHGSLCLCVV